MSEIAFDPELTPPRALRSETPTIVRGMCTSSQQITVWASIRWLLENFPGEPPSSRDIAIEAKVNQKTVATTIAQLVKLRLLEIVRYEEYPGRGKLGGSPVRKPILRIPGWIERQNQQYTEQYMIQLRAQREKTRTRDHPTKFVDPKTDQRLDPFSDQQTAVDPKTDQGVDPKTDQQSQKNTYVGREVGREGGIAPTRAEKPEHQGPGTPSPSSAPPLPPPSYYTLPAHPLAMWRDACPTARPIDAKHLAALAAEHDASTGGFGWYWVGRAILAASLSQDARKVTVIKTILDGWRERAAYGSDAPGRQRKRDAYEQQTRAASERLPSDRRDSPPARPSAGPDRPTGRSAGSGSAASSDPPVRSKIRLADGTLVDAQDYIAAQRKQ
jgi:hypothetical protein